MSEIAENPEGEILEPTGPEETVTPELEPDPGPEPVDPDEIRERPGEEIPGEEEVPEGDFHTPAEAGADDEVDDKESETYD